MAHQDIRAKWSYLYFTSQIFPSQYIYPETGNLVKERPEAFARALALAAVARAAFSARSIFTMAGQRKCGPGPSLGRSALLPFFGAAPRAALFNVSHSRQSFSKGPHSARGELSSEEPPRPVEAPGRGPRAGKSSARGPVPVAVAAFATLARGSSWARPASAAPCVGSRAAASNQSARAPPKSPIWKRARPRPAQ